MSKWMPIESAPKDGTEFLVFLPGERKKVQVAWQNNAGVRVIGGQFSFDVTAPTHWMPIPEPPEAAK